MKKYYDSRSRMSLKDSLAMILVLGIAILILASLVSKVCGAPGIAYSDGQRTGLVYKISKKGIIWKTWEGQMSMQMMTRDQNGQLVNQVFNFSVSDDAVARQIESASSAGKPITLQYTQYLLRGWNKGITGYDITGINTPAGQ